MRTPYGVRTFLHFRICLAFHRNHLYNSALTSLQKILTWPIPTSVFQSYYLPFSNSGRTTRNFASVRLERLERTWHRFENTLHIRGMNLLFSIKNLVLCPKKSGSPAGSGPPSRLHPEVQGDALFLQRKTALWRPSPTSSRTANHHRVDTTQPLTPTKLAFYELRQLRCRSFYHGFMSQENAKPSPFYFS